MNQLLRWLRLTFGFSQVPEICEASKGSRGYHDYPNNKGGDTTNIRKTMEITKIHLLAACDLAERAENQPVDVSPLNDEGKDELPVLTRRYDQHNWDCGTACCIHGFAHILARGAEAGGPPEAGDYADLDTDVRTTVYEFLGNEFGTPEMVRRAVSGDIKLGSGRTLGREYVIGHRVSIGELYDIDDRFTVGDDTQIGDELFADWWVSVGKKCRIGSGVNIESESTVGDDVVIGNEVSIAYKVMIGNSVTVGNHSQISDRASIGEGCKIGNGVTIGAHAIIGDGAVIGKDAVIGDAASVSSNVTIGPGEVVATGVRVMHDLPSPGEVTDG